MKTPVFSILIPVYNVEDYLEDCLESILNQTFDNFEVIMVDDGSTDNSYKLCEEITSIDKRFKLYTQNNQGLLLTRRRLFELSKGEYIISLDSDDFIEHNMLQKIYDEFIANNSDIVLFRHYITDNEGNKIKESKKVFENKVVFGENNKMQLLKVFFTSSSINSICFKAVKRSIIDINEDYSMFKDVKGEDALQSIALFKNADVIIYLNECLSNYRSSLNNRTNNFKVKYFDDFNTVQNEIYKFMNSINKIDDELVQKFFKYYFAMIRIYLSSAIASLNYSEYNLVIQKLITNDLFSSGVSTIKNSNGNYHDKFFIKLLMRYPLILKTYIRGYSFARKIYNSL